MKQEDKELLIKEICARLPYGVIAKVYSYWNEEYFDDKLVGIDLEENDVLAIALPGGRCEIDLVKPYLRPMSSMTEEEEDEYEKVIRESFEQQLEFYLRRHLDFRGLIPKGLAIEAPEGMYIL